MCCGRRLRFLICSSSSSRVLAGDGSPVHCVFSRGPAPLPLLPCSAIHFEATAKSRRSSSSHTRLNPNDTKAMASYPAQCGWLYKMSPQSAEQERALKELFDEIESGPKKSNGPFVDESTRCNAKCGNKYKTLR